MTEATPRNGQVVCTRFIPAGSRRKGGILAGLVACLVVLGAAAVLAWIFLLPVFLEETIETRLGVPIRIQRLVANPFSGELSVQGLVVENPVGFPGREFLSIRTLEATGDISEIWHGRWTLDHLSVHVARLTLMKDGAGRSNIDRVWAQGAPPLSVKSLRLKVDQVAVFDSAGRKTEYEIGFEKRSEWGHLMADTMLPLAKAIAAQGNAARECVQGVLGQTQSTTSVKGETLSQPSVNQGGKAGGFWDGLRGKK